jgi:alpha-mannosidase
MEDGEVIEPFSYWALPNTYFTLNTSFVVSIEWGTEAKIALVLPLGDPRSFSHPEALLYIDGVPLGTADRHHQEILLPDTVRDGGEHSLVLHGWSGYGHYQGEHGRLLMGEGELVLIDQPTRDFTVLANTALGVADYLPDGTPVKSDLYTALDEAFKRLDTHEPFGDGFYNSVQGAHERLLSGIKECGAPMNVNIAGVGHAHLDVAWLWTLADTRAKAARTFYTVMHLMDQFPEYIFVQSQPQLYEFVRQDHPDLFRQIQTKVAEGRWEALGGMWVEADCNISGGEALVRQFLLGRTFFKKHFGEGSDSPVLWLPDVFGYSWALPQLIKDAGLDYFFTIKISWNQYNRLPYDSFWWQGLDGTRVLTHFSTTPEYGTGNSSTYNAQVLPEDGLRTWENFQQKDVQRDVLMVFGYGDGGGGPTREMLETIQELKEFPAVPSMRHDKVGEYFKHMEESIGDKLPTWNGELYLEYHRGTYTTQARNKRANRKSEFRLHDAEFLASFARILDEKYDYPFESLRLAWQLLCLNQFHDIIPGSSIGEVYADSQSQYDQISTLAGEVIESSLDVIGGHISGDVLIINPTSFERSAVMPLGVKLKEDQSLVQAGAEPVWVQQDNDQTLIHVEKIPAYSVNGFDCVENVSALPDTKLTATAESLENRYLRLELNHAGDITRIYDKVHERDVLPAGAIGNQFQAFEDRPLDWDAWDLEIYYDDRKWLSDRASSIDVVSSGPLRASLRIKRQILNSPYEQVITLDHDSALIRFDTKIDWRERHVLLKVAFPVNILSPQATHEIQWGNVERPTHRNTSWDWARFETCAHKWVDLSEGDYGVSLLNDCKYGHDIANNVIRLSLLKSPTWPDENADVGEHTFTYALLPHTGTWREGTIPAAYGLNNPLILKKVHRYEGHDFHQLLSVEPENVVIETVKWAEDGRGLIVRLYESQRKRGKVTIHTGFDVDRVFITNMLEEGEDSATVSGRVIEFDVRPYQIVTLRIIPDV